MNAYDQGLAVLNASILQFIQVKLDALEQEMITDSHKSDDEFTINVRKHLCIA